MDDKTLESMRTRVQQAEVLKTGLEHLQKGRTILADKETTKSLHITIGGENKLFYFEPEVSGELLLAALRKNILDGLDSLIAKLQAEYAKL